MSTGLARRDVAPEQLDALAHDDPRAVASRGDLRRINVLMGQAGIAASLVRAHLPAPPRRVADLGCGDGVGALRFLRRIGPAPEGATLELVDMRPVVRPETLSALEALGWSVRVAVADVIGWLEARREALDLATANLFLHHFEDRALGRLLGLAADRAAHLVATEPLRSPLGHLAARSVGAIGANSVTRHDAPASVRAGFRGRELSALWPGTALFEGRRGPFTHAFAGGAA